MSGHAKFEVDNQPLKLADIDRLLQQEISLSNKAISTINNCRDFLDKKLANSSKPFYGINTGFGDLCDVQISEDQLETLQHNLVISHACGVGNEVPEVIVKTMLLLKVLSLAKGYSGIHLDTIQRLVEFYNQQVLPVVYDIGSLGASGDLAPLAHLSLPILGEGVVNFKGSRYTGKEVLQQLQLSALELHSKEGLALLNGTQFMQAYGVTIINQIKKLFEKLHLIAAISLDAMHAKTEPFHPAIHRIRKQEGQAQVAAKMLELLSSSDIANTPKETVQDPYCMRCIPQVHGASLDVFKYVEGVFEKEINAVTDNPNVIPEEDVILSGGNFHGQPLAMALDYLAIAIAELGSISERRCYKLLSGINGLPLFLAKEPGLNSGYMIPQYTAAALVSKNKQLCTPASVDTIDSSNGQEDHVSMGANAATKCYQVLQNVAQIFAIELLLGAQALEFRRPQQSSPKVEAFMSAFRKEVPFAEQDRWLHEDIKKAHEFLSAGL